MAAKRISARQKMINLMYLIFIAMLALNIDREVLRSFEGINISLETSADLTSKNNITFYDNMVKTSKEDESYVPIVAEASIIRTETDKFVSYISGLKNKLSDGYVAGAEETDYNSLQSTDPVINLLFKGGDQDKGNQEATNLLDKINKYHEFMSKYAKTEDDKFRLNEFFDTKSKTGNWVREKFYNQPMVAVLTNLSKIQSDARTEEGNIMRTLLTGKLEAKIELDKFKGIVLGSAIVRKGDKSPATIVLGAYDSSIKGTATTSAGTFSMTGGAAEFNLNSASIGKHTITGKIQYVVGGKTQEIEIEPMTYNVVAETIVDIPSGGIVKADNMNVVYRGVVNPMSGTVNGADGAVSLVATGGNLTKTGAGKWNYSPGAGNTVTFTVSAKTGSGKVISGKEEFRIKNVPPARGIVLGKTAIAMPAASLAAQTVKVDWPDFLFPITANVTSFKVKVPGHPTSVVNGSNMSAAGGALSKAQKGDLVGVFDIKYVSSTGIQGVASGINIEVR